MYALIVTEKGGSPRKFDFDKDDVTVGRVVGNDIVLAKGNVSKRHTKVVRQEGRYYVVDLKSTNGTYLNGRRIMNPTVIKVGDKIYVGDFVLTLEAEDGLDEADVIREPSPFSASPDVSGSGAALEAEPIDDEIAPPVSSGTFAPTPVVHAPTRPVPGLGGLNALAGGAVPSMRPITPAPLPRVNSPLRAPMPSPSLRNNTLTREEQESVTSRPPPPATAAAPVVIAKQIAPPTVRAPWDEPADDDVQDAPVPEPDEPLTPVAAPPARAARAASGRSFADRLTALLAAADRAGIHAIADDEPFASARTRVRDGLAGVAGAEPGLFDADDADDLRIAAECELAGGGLLERALADVGARRIVASADGRTSVTRDDGSVGPGPVATGTTALATAWARMLRASGLAQSAGDRVEHYVLRDGVRATRIPATVAVHGPMLVLERSAPGVIALDSLVARGALDAKCAEQLGAAIASGRNVVVAATSAAVVDEMVLALAVHAGEGDRVTLVAKHASNLPMMRGADVLDANDDGLATRDAIRALDTARLALGAGVPSALFAEALERAVSGHDGLVVGVEAASPRAALARWVHGLGDAESKLEAHARLAATRTLVVQLARFADGRVRVAQLAEATPDGVTPVLVARVSGTSLGRGLDVTWSAPAGA